MDLSFSSRLNLSITSGEIESYHRDGSGGFGEFVGHWLGGTDAGDIKRSRSFFHLSDSRLENLKNTEDSQRSGPMNSERCS